MSPQPYLILTFLQCIFLNDFIKLKTQYHSVFIYGICILMKNCECYICCSKTLSLGHCTCILYRSFDVLHSKKLLLHIMKQRQKGKPLHSSNQQFLRNRVNGAYDSGMNNWFWEKDILENCRFLHKSVPNSL